MKRGRDWRKVSITLLEFGGLLLIALIIQAIVIWFIGSLTPQIRGLPELGLYSPFFSIVGTIFSAFAFSGILFTVYKQAKDSSSIAATQRLQTLITFIDAMRIRARYLREEADRPEEAEEVELMLEKIYEEVKTEYQLLFKEK